MQFRKLTVACLCCLLWLASPLRAQDTPSGTDDSLSSANTGKNIRLRLQLDRTSIHAFEPVYLCVSADRFSDNIAPDIEVREKDQSAVDLGAMEQQWIQPDAKQTPRRMRVLLVQATNSAQPHYLFPEPGEYRMRVKIGPDFTTLRIDVEPGNPDDPKAFSALGSDNFAAMLTEPEIAVPPPQLIKTCQTVVNSHPDSIATAYCRAYLATAAFKDAARIYQKAGGKPVWAPVAQQLSASLVIFNGTCYGEEIAYYTAYAQGLSGDFPAAIQTIDGTRSHLTLWADQMDKMKQAIASHLRPVDVQPNRPGR